MVLDVRDTKTLDFSTQEEFYYGEWRKCQKNLLYYLTHYVYIEDAVTQKIILWVPHPHLLQLITLVQEWFDQKSRNPCYIIVFKSKKVFTTTLLSGIASWLVSFNQSTKGLTQSIGISEATDFLNKIRFITEHHPEFMRLKALPNRDTDLGFPATSSLIKALPSTETAGRGADSTFVFLDEWEFHRNAESNYAAIQSSMARGGLLIAVSTPDKTDLDTYPKKIWRGSPANGFTRLFWGYFVVPYRNEDTYQRDTASLPAWRAEGEFARNEKEALSAPKTLGYFQHDILEKYLELCRDPIETKYGGRIRIWRPSITNRSYVFAIDSSEGVEDPAVGIIGDKTEDAACFNGKISLDEQAKIANELYKEYNEPLMIIENNAGGLTLIEKLKNLGVTNWYYSPTDKEKRKPGIHTGPNRELILTQHAESIHLRQRDIPIRDCIEQHYDFAWINNKPQAVKGKHDDWVMCEAILEQGLKLKPPGVVRISSYKYGG